MSTSSATGPATTPATTTAAAAGRRPSRRRPSAAPGRLLRSELGLVFRRRRNLVLLAVLALVPVLIGTAVELSSSSPNPGEGPPFIDRVAGNGLFLVLTSLVAVLPLFLPLAVGVVAGDAVAGEANLGTLRYLLVVPVRRGRLLAVKYGALLAFCLAAALVVGVAALATGLALFPGGEVTLLSGATITFSSALLRMLGIVLYVGASMAGLAAIGLFVSTLTEVPVAAMATTIGLSVVSQVLDTIPQLDWLHPWLFSHYWLAFGDLLRQPVPTGDLTLGLLTQAGYVAAFGALAWSRFSTSDVSA
jgi:ABC-2 type transport system permease protein